MLGSTLNRRFLLGCVVLAALAVCFAIIVAREYARQRALLAEAAAELAGRIGGAARRVGGGWQVDGTSGGSPVMVRLSLHFRLPSHQDSSPFYVPWVEIAVPCSARHEELEIRRRFVSRVVPGHVPDGSAGGELPESSLEATFDGVFDVTSGRPEQVRELLSPGVRRILLIPYLSTQPRVWRLWVHSGEVGLRQSFARYSRPVTRAELSDDTMSLIQVAVEVAQRVSH